MLRKLSQLLLRAYCVRQVGASECGIVGCGWEGESNKETALRDPGSPERVTGQAFQKRYSRLQGRMLWG